METPNKIYLEKDKETDKIHHLWGRSPVIHSGYGHIEYIRKDALLEWANNRQEECDLYDEYEAGLYDGLQEMIDKIESL